MDRILPDKALTSRYLPMLKLAIGETVFVSGMPGTVQRAASKWGHRINTAYRTASGYSISDNSIGCWVTRIG